MVEPDISFFSLYGSGLLNWIFVTAFSFITTHLYSTVNLGLTTEYSALYRNMWKGRNA